MINLIHTELSIVYKHNMLVRVLCSLIIAELVDNTLILKAEVVFVCFHNNKINLTITIF